MWRNKAFRVFTSVFFMLSLGMLLLSFYLPTYLVILIYIFLNYTIFTIYTHRRYQNIQELSRYLQSVYQGLEFMDIREYCEGELSALKSDLYKLIHVLQEQRDLLRKDKQFLADSLSDISHQIKTPLTSMLVVSDLLREEIPEQKRIEFIVVLQNQLKRLQWLVSSLLKMSKIDANAVIFHLQDTPLFALLKECSQPFQIPIELKHQQLYIECDDEVIIQADHPWLLEAFSNIIKNAIDHTPEHGIIQIRVKETPLHIVMEVEDNGTGIDEEDLLHIFERFYRGKNASSDSVGIGLALSRAILIQHQASIQATCKAMHGTTFTITFYK